MARKPTINISDSVREKCKTIVVKVTRKSDGASVDCKTLSVDGNADVARTFLTEQTDSQVCTIADMLLQRSDRQKAANGKDQDTILLEEITAEIGRGKFDRAHMLDAIGKRLAARNKQTKAAA